MNVLSIPLMGRDGSIRAYALVDPEDFERFGELSWSLDGLGYASRRGQWNGKRYPLVRMHREIMGLEHGDKREVDHANRNRLDNRRENLRIVTRAEQMQNYPSLGGTSLHRGVCWNKRNSRWRAYCNLAGKHHHLGYFAREEDAAAAAAAFRRERMPFSIEGTTT